MFISPKRYIKTADGKVVEAGPGISGTLVAAEGAEMDEREAQALGILAGGAKSPDASAEKKPWAAGDKNQPSALPLGSTNQAAEELAKATPTFSSANVKK